MNICIATTNFPPDTGGIATYYGNLVKLLLEAGHKVILLTICHDDNNMGEDVMEIKNDLTIVTFKRSFTTYLKKYQPYFSKGDLDAPRWIASGYAMHDWLIKFHKTYGLEIIEVPDYGGLGIFLINKNLPPVVITGHGCYLQLSRYNPSNSNSHSRTLKKLELLSFEYADEIIPYSPFNADDLSRITGRNISYLNAPWLSRNVLLTDTTEAKTIVVGGLQKIKGALTAANAVRLVAKMDPNFKLTWIGGDTYTAPGLKKMSTYLEQNFAAEWNTYFYWAGNRPHEETMLSIAGSAIVVIPAEWETFNFVSLEAASLEKAIIITDKTGAVYLFKHRYDAYIIPADDPRALADAIMVLKNDHDLRKMLGKNAAETVRRNFQASVDMQKRIERYKEVCRKSRQPLPENEIGFLSSSLTLHRKLFYKLKYGLKKLLFPKK
jgi:glycosyltransferase involved in cell wall biosynthesis